MLPAGMRDRGNLNVDQNNNGWNYFASALGVLLAIMRVRV